ncbi:MAG: helix-turn-helix domain-containing protein, partial [Flavobacteriaceae bacterium]
EQESLYLNSNPTIHELSQKLNSNSKSISYILNNEFKQNFVSFINTYRINAAKEILSNSKYQNYTIEAIGEEVGFNSKSAFNRAFKKYTDTTPSQYRNNQ